jgi:hypothetical protein
MLLAAMTTVRISTRAILAMMDLFEGGLGVCGGVYGDMCGVSCWDVWQPISSNC